MPCLANDLCNFINFDANNIEIHIDKIMYNVETTTAPNPNESTDTNFATYAICPTMVTTTNKVYSDTNTVTVTFDNGMNVPWNT